MSDTTNIEQQVPQWYTLVLAMFLVIKVFIKYGYKLFKIFSKRYGFLSCEFNSCCGLFSGQAEASETEIEHDDDITQPATLPDVSTPPTIEVGS